MVVVCCSVRTMILCDLFKKEKHKSLIDTNVIIIIGL